MRRSRRYRRLPVALAPQLVQGCRLWLAADQIRGVASGGKVAVWPDLGPFANSAVQATDASRPTLLQPARVTLPAVYFANTGTYLSLSNMVLSDFTIFAVYILQSLLRPAHYLLGGSGVGLHGGGTFAGVNGWGLYDGAVTLIASDEPTDIWTLMTWQNSRLFRNGVEATYSASGTSAGMTLNVLGRRETSWADGYWNGYLAELIVFDAVLNPYDRRLIESYLGTKYELTVAA